MPKGASSTLNAKTNVGTQTAGGIQMLDGEQQLLAILMSNEGKFPGLDGKASPEFEP